MTDPNAFEMAISAQPEDGVAYRLYGDWLCERGHALGELIALHSRRGEPPDAIDMKTEETLLRRSPHLYGGAFVQRCDLRVAWHLGHWRVLNLGQFIYDFDETDYSRAASAPFANQLLRSSLARFLRVLNINVEGDLSGSITDAIASLHRTLRSLTLFSETGWRDLQPLAACCHLQRLELLNEVPSRELATLLPELKALETLALRTTSNTVIQSLRGLRLTAFSTNALTEFSVEGATALATHPLRQLMLHDRTLELAPEVLRAFRDHPTLEYASFGPSPPLDVIRSVRALSFMTLSPGFERIDSKPAIDRLEWLWMGNSQVSRDVIGALGRLCHLKTLHVVAPRESHDLEQFRALSNLRSLEHLHFIEVSDVDDSVIHALRDLPNLETLSVMGCRNVTDASVDGLLLMTKLAAVDLSETRITSKGLERLAKHPRLRRVTLLRDSLSPDELERISAIGQWVVSEEPLFKQPILEFDVSVGRPLPHATPADAEILETA